MRGRTLEKEDTVVRVGEGRYVWNRPEVGSVQLPHGNKYTGEIEGEKQTSVRTEGERSRLVRAPDTTLRTGP